MKKFKREKAREKHLAEQQAIKIYDDEQRAERLMQAKERREREDEQLAKKKMQEHLKA